MAAVTTARPAPSAPIATAAADDITPPRDIVEQLYAQLARLDVLERATRCAWCAGPCDRDDLPPMV